MIETTGLPKPFGEIPAVNHITTKIRAGAAFGPVGTNGAGKSTTIKALLRLIRPEEGEISLLGKKDGAAFREIKEQIGAAFDESYFPDNLRIKDVDRIMRSIFKTWESDKFLSYCRRFELPGKKTVKEFSRGMKMKLSIAAALSHQTKLLILDEATSGLDPVVRSEILDIFQEFIQEEDHTVFLSSHITSDIERIADYILLIHKGRILLFEDKDTLLYEYGIVRCTREQADRLDQKQVVGRRENQFETEVLVKNVRELQEKPGLVVDRASLEDILLFTVKNGMEEKRR